MIRSMTGYGKGRATGQSFGLAVEVRSVNGRGREIRFRLPQELYALESALRDRVQAVIARGRIDVNVHWDGGAPQEARYALNAAGAQAMLSAWRQLGSSFDLHDLPTAGALLRLPGVVEPVGGGDTDEAALAELAVAALDAALADHRGVREREGRKLAVDLTARSRRIATLVGEIKERTADLPARWAEQLRQRVTQLLAEPPVDEARIAQEIALTVQKADVTEELVRLEAHLGRLAALFGDGAQEIGQKLEFLVQEIRREVNTLSAKAGTPDIDERALEIKTELERIREQAANLE